MIRFSTLVPISVPFRIIAPFDCVFVNMCPYSNKHPHSNKRHHFNKPHSNRILLFTWQGCFRRDHWIGRRRCRNRMLFYVTLLKLHCIDVEVEMNWNSLLFIEHSPYICSVTVSVIVSSKINITVCFEHWVVSQKRNECPVPNKRPVLNKRPPLRYQK